MRSILKLLPKGRVTLLNDILRQIDILNIMQSIQTERPVIVAEQVVEVYVIVWLWHALYLIRVTKIKDFL